MYYFIVNPKSSSGKGLKIWRKVADIMQGQQVDYQVFFTKGPGHATELATTLCTSHTPCTIVAVGGDGTANEVINGLCNYRDIRFGYIPTGSGNDLARGLSLPVTPAEALSAILNPTSIQYLSVGINESESDSRKFIVSSGIGYDAAVCHEALHSKMKNVLNRFGLGKLTYLCIALKQLILLKPAPLTLTLDDTEPPFVKDAFFAAMMNLKYEGGGFMFCPKANAQDDYLDICVVEQMSKLRVLCLLPTALKGKHVNKKGIHILRCKKIEIRASRNLAVHTDGEEQGFHEWLRTSLSSEKLPVITG